ncbi:MAG: acyl-CoA dehydrogenase [Rhodospirillaceae bacterium]|nr:acyl-CoA dehydrogenase [Rhodospirillaceae bacterium]MYH39151.1 acyl-CoA dehydrogenase [Rhodospirillaceae bacterium]MYK15051.1 acyl-CoA dehydrogenase [Rhodospirillaceae bacterium]MYK60108.1 acyl-CoA dehydrogenase [Rhodospirillaceae bacterium]
MLTDDQIMIRDTARQFAQERLAPTAAERDRTGETPRGLLAEMGALGFMGMTIPEEWGGAGADTVAYVLAMEEIAGGDGGVSTVMSVNNSPVAAALFGYGSTEQKERFLKPLARGEINAAFSLTEPQAGSDASNLKTRAEKRGNKYVLNGAKQFISSGATADINLMFAVTDPAAGKRGISAFIVPTDTPGYKVVRKEEKLGQRSSDTCALILEDMEATPDLLVGQEGEGYRIALANLEAGRIGVAAQATGMARAAYEHAVAYAKERVSFGKPIVEHQAVAFRLADMATQIEAAHQMALNVARLKDAGRPCLKEAAMAKLFASEMAERVCSDAIQIHGGYGYLQDFPVERIWRDVRVCKIYEGTSDVQKMIISRAIAAE